MSAAQLLSSGLQRRSLRRLASRLAFMRSLGLADPPSLAWARASMAQFLRGVGEAAGRPVGGPEFDSFLAGWLASEEGRRWGARPCRGSAKKGGAARRRGAASGRA